MKKTIIWLIAFICIVGIGLTSCENEDYEYYKVEQTLFGEWESDTIKTNETNGIIFYHIDIVPSDKHSVSPYRMIVKRKDGQYYLYKKGFMGHRNDDPNDIMNFDDKLDSYGGWDLKVEWLNKEKTRIVLYRDKSNNDIVFHKTKNTTDYENYWWK